MESGAADHSQGDDELAVGAQHHIKVAPLELCNNSAG